VYPLDKSCVLRHHVSQKKRGMGLREKKERKTKMRVTNLTVSELKKILEDYELEGKGDLEVRVAQQPTYPMGSDVLAVTRVGDTVWIAADGFEDYITKKPWGEDDVDEEDDGDEE